MLRPYTKKPLSLDDLLTHLESRGMVFADRTVAARELGRIGYYRLKGYIHHFRRVPTNSDLQPGTRFEQPLWFYQFDGDLRMAVMRGLERVEIGIRAILTSRLTAAGGCFAHRDPNLLQMAKSDSGKVVFDPIQWLTDLDEAVNKNKDEAFIVHFRQNYTDFPRIPCWMALELTSFGELSRIYRGCPPQMRDAMADDFGINERVLGSWLLTLSHVRNFCAHHGRLWNRSFNIKPLILKGRKNTHWEQAPRDRMFIRLAIIRHVLRRLHDEDEWAGQIEKGFGQDFSNPMIAVRMGFPFEMDAQGKKVLLDWRQHPLWTGKVP